MDQIRELLQWQQGLSKHKLNKERSLAEKRQDIEANLLSVKDMLKEEAQSELVLQQEITKLERENVLLGKQITEEKQQLEILREKVGESAFQRFQKRQSEILQQQQAEYEIEQQQHLLFQQQLQQQRMLQQRLQEQKARREEPQNLNDTLRPLEQMPTLPPQHCTSSPGQVEAHSQQEFDNRGSPSQQSLRGDALLKQAQPFHREQAASQPTGSATGGVKAQLDQLLQLGLLSSDEYNARVAQLAPCELPAPTPPVASLLSPVAVETQMNTQPQHQSSQYNESLCKLQQLLQMGMTFASKP